MITVISLEGMVKTKISIGETKWESDKKIHIDSNSVRLSVLISCTT